MNKKVIVVSSVAALLLGSSAVFAHEKALGGDIAVDGDAANGLVSAGGNAIVTGLGECSICRLSFLTARSVLFGSNLINP